MSFYGGLQSVRINVFHVRWGGGELRCVLFFWGDGGGSQASCEKGARVSVEIEGWCFIVARWGFLNATFINRRLLERATSHGRPHQNRNPGKGYL